MAGQLGRGHEGPAHLPEGVVALEPPQAASWLSPQVGREQPPELQCRGLRGTHGKGAPRQLCWTSGLEGKEDPDLPLEERQCSQGGDTTGLSRMGSRTGPLK